jgi:SAM-dependent methyltransferase
MSDPTRRFSDRVEAYIRYRPGYPGAVLEFLKAECGLTPGSVIADVGSGTGIFSEVFLRHGCSVFGVEPNREMRGAAERLLAGYPRFVSVDGTAEATTLVTRSVEFVAAGQAFHWFDRARAREEFARILKPGGWVMLAWNRRRKAGSAIADAYERLLLEYGTDYRAVDHENVTDEVIADFFARGPVNVARFENNRTLDYQHLEGYLASASYAPGPGHPDHAPMLAGLRAIFAACERGGRVTLEVDTTVYVGQLAAAV